MFANEYKIAQINEKKGANENKSVQMNTKECSGLLIRRHVTPTVYRSQFRNRLCQCGVPQPFQSSKSRLPSPL